jgi:hypothetical protein
MKRADLIFPLRGKTAAKQPVGGKYGDRVRSIPWPFGEKLNLNNALRIKRSRLSDALKPAVFLSHLVARKGRKASDHCGGGG